MLEWSAERDRVPVCVRADRATACSEGDATPTIGRLENFGDWIEGRRGRDVCI